MLAVPHTRLCVLRLLLKDKRFIVALDVSIEHVRIGFYANFG